MSAIQELQDKIVGIWQNQINQMRSRIFGANNEHLDFVMDSFYKLESSKQKMVLVAVTGGIGFLVVLLFGVYMAQVQALKSELNESFAALASIRQLNKENNAVNSKFDKLTSTILRKNNDVNFKPFFEKISQAQSVELRGINEKRVPLAPENPIASKMQEVHVDMEMQNVSIPRLLKFLTEVEKSDKFMRVHNLIIRSKHGTKLYFDTEVKVRGYIEQK